MRLSFADKSGQFLPVILVLAAEADFLRAQAVELLLIGDEGLGFDQDFDCFTSMISEILATFKASEGINAEFEVRNAVEAPLGIGKALHEFGFASGGRVPVGKESVDVSLVKFGVCGRTEATFCRYPSGWGQGAGN